MYYLTLDNPIKQLIIHSIMPVGVIDNFILQINPDLDIDDTETIA